MKEPLLAERMTMMQKAFEVEQRRHYKKLQQGNAPVRRLDPAASYLSPPPETVTPYRAVAPQATVEDSSFSTPVSRSWPTQPSRPVFRTPDSAPVRFPLRAAVVAWVVAIVCVLLIQYPLRTWPFSRGTAGATGTG